MSGKLERLLFLYASADGPCSLCRRRGHLIAACGFEVRAGSRKQGYNGIELCPGCLRREREEAVRTLMPRLRRDLIGGMGAPITRLDHENLRDIHADCADLAALVERGEFLLPPLLPARWIARRK